MSWLICFMSEIGGKWLAYFSHYMWLVSDSWSIFKLLQYRLCGCSWFPAETASCGHPLDFYALLLNACIATILSILFHKTARFVILAKEKGIIWA